jgi:hypothetical protein
VAALVGTGTPAASYELVTDTADGVWVLDEASGALRRCRSLTDVGPKVLDVFGGVGEARPERPYPGRTVCEVALRPESWGEGAPGVALGAYGGLLEVAVRSGMLGDGSSGVQVGVGAGMLGDGGYGGYDAPDTQVIIVRPDRDGVALY